MLWTEYQFARKQQVSSDYKCLLHCSTKSPIVVVQRCSEILVTLLDDHSAMPT